MNNRGPVRIEGRFRAGAARILDLVPGLLAEPRPAGKWHQNEATVRHGGDRIRVRVVHRALVNAATAWQLARRSKDEPAAPLLVVAGRTTAEARRILEAHGVAFVDDLGNAHIELPGLLMHTEGRQSRRQRDGHGPPARLRGKAGVIAQSLLLEPRRDWRVQDLAQEAGVSAGLAHRVLARLQREGVLTTSGKGPQRTRRVEDPAALLDLWVEENEDRPTTTLAYRLAQSMPQLIEQIGTGLEARGIHYAVTGPAAARELAPFVTAVPVVHVWCTEAATSRTLCEAAGAEEVSEGQSIVFLQAKDDLPLAFRRKEGKLWTVNRFRLYFDLRNDPRRGREQAEHLRREIIGF